MFSTLPVKPTSKSVWDESKCELGLDEMRANHLNYTQKAENWSKERTNSKMKSPKPRKCINKLPYPTKILEQLHISILLSI